MLTARTMAITISKVDGIWTVTRPPAFPAKLFPGDEVTWKLLPDPDNPNKRISAHLQFCHDNFVLGVGLSRDWTASIGPVGGGIPEAYLTLTIHDAAEKSRKHHYAVWVCDQDLRPTFGTFALGVNPPPELDLGP